MRADEQKRHIRPSPRVRQHTCRRSRNRGYGKWRGYAREVHVLIRGDLYSMQYEIISSEIAGGVPVPKYPGTVRERPALL